MNHIDQNYNNYYFQLDPFLVLVLVFTNKFPWNCLADRLGRPLHQVILQLDEQTLKLLRVFYNKLLSQQLIHLPPYPSVSATMHFGNEVLIEFLAIHQDFRLAGQALLNKVINHYFNYINYLLDYLSLTCFIKLTTHLKVETQVPVFSLNVKMFKKNWSTNIYSLCKLDHFAIKIFWGILLYQLTYMKTVSKLREH